MAKTFADEEGNPFIGVGTGADFWTRRTNTTPGCACPPSRYNPRTPKPVNPTCPLHGQGEPPCATSSNTQNATNDNNKPNG